MARDHSIAISVEIGIRQDTHVRTVALGILAQPWLAAPAAVDAIAEYMIVPVFGRTDEDADADSRTT